MKSKMRKTYGMKRYKIILFMILVLGRVDFILAQEENLNIFDRWIEWTDGNNMLAHHLNQQAFALLDTRDIKVAGLKTREDWETRKRMLKEILLKTVGPF